MLFHQNEASNTCTEVKLARNWRHDVSTKHLPPWFQVQPVASTVSEIKIFNKWK